MLAFKVWSDTKANCRAVLGERVTAWLRLNPEACVTRHWVQQSSDAEFHCQSIICELDVPQGLVLREPEPVDPQPPQGPRRVRRNGGAA